MDWRSAYDIGIARIDAQHRELLARADELVEAAQRKDGAGVDRALGFLRTYVAEHFRLEEAEMAAIGYPEAAAHASEHARFTADLRAIGAEHAAAPASPWPTVKLAVELGHWLRGHILGTDQRFGAFLKARGHAASARPV